MKYIISVLVLGLLWFMSMGAIWFLNRTISDYEWTLPARFEAQGAITLGCALWDVPYVTEYSDDNPNVGFWGISGSKEEMLLLVDGPQGSTIVHGNACGISIDWGAFPGEQRPVPEEVN